MVELPVHVSLRDDDLRRSRLTVFFRLLLVLPHLIWLVLWSYLLYLIVFFVWLAAVFLGRLPDWAHRFFGAYVRYSLHVTAYLTAAANPFPGFLGRPGSYPVDLDIAPRDAQNRAGIFFRLILVLPASLLVSYGVGAVLFTVAFFAWFACLATGRMPRGFRDSLVYSLGYSAQTSAYSLLLTGRYPDSDPAAAPGAELPEHAIRLDVGDDLRRSRLTVFFRYLLYLPHAVWLWLWSIVAYLAAIVGWFAALFTGRLPGGLHRFLAAWLRYWVHVNAFLYLTANPFPGFIGKPGSYPVDLDIAPGVPQSRWVTFGRVLLAIPAYTLAAALSLALAVAGFLAWFAALFTGEMPRGLRNLQAYALRYYAQFYAYTFLLTAQYPDTGPGPVDRASADVPPVPEAV
jgi:Domain of unknown function (DUF4389)